MSDAFVNLYHKKLYELPLDIEILIDPMDLKPRSNLSLVLGCIPHLVILVFAVLVVWTAKPSSSESLLILYRPNEILLNVKLCTGLFSWHPTLMSLAVSS